MKFYVFALAAAASVLSVFPFAAAGGEPAPVVYETAREFFASADFDRDGRVDLVIVDKETGKYRLGFKTATGLFNWVDCRPSGIKGITGFSIGSLLRETPSALAFTSPDANQISLVNASSPVTSARPLVIQFTAALGPSTVAAIDVGGEGNSPLADLFVTSIYNSPDENLETLLRNDGADFPKILEIPLPGTAVRANRVSLQPGQPEALAFLAADGQGMTLRLEDFSSGKPVSLASIEGLPAGGEYIAANFRGTPLPELIIYKPGEKRLAVRPVQDAAPGRVTLGAGDSFELPDPICRAIAVNSGAGQRLMVLFGAGEKAGLFTFDGVKAPALAQSFQATNELFTCAAGFPGGLLLFSQPTGGKFSTRYYYYKAAGAAYVAGAFGGLASLADNDNIIIPDLYSRILAQSAVTKEAGMKPYTNAIPGTRVSFAMVPIPAGEFVMGSPDGEKGRKPDEGPQHKVRISPFWMGRYEITWNEYELFMYPDEEKRSRATLGSDAGGDKLADAITHPSKPYVEMSFGMGKDGFPAISMTQHAANKYCQWLSAKTGYFYRLPTEAEWEYAARAGTTTAYFFGDDASKLGDYAWFEQNSDFKYQKVGKKKPNPWGLYDIYGNVVEWVLDQYAPEYYKECNALGVVTEPWNRATKPYPHSVRGGSWDDPEPLCRSAARRGSDRTWKMQDPQLPKSVWYLSDAQFVGFRVVRPLEVPPPEQMQKAWTSGVERD